VHEEAASLARGRVAPVRVVDSGAGNGAGVDDKYGRDALAR